mgnify:CR=1 FL=1
MVFSMLLEETIKKSPTMALMKITIANAHAIAFSHSLKDDGLRFLGLRFVFLTGFFDTQQSYAVESVLTAELF